MSVVDLPGDSSTITAFLGTVKNALWEAFETPFAIWQRRDSWTLSPDGCEFDDYATREQVATALEAHVDRGHEGGAVPFVLLADSDSPLLVIPLGHSADVGIAASASFPRTPAPILISMAKLFLREFEQRWQILQLSDENEAFVNQVTTDFEELTFLRGIAEQLEISDLSYDLAQLAQITLPMLQPLIGAKGIVVVTCGDELIGEHRSSPFVEHPLIWIGERQLDDATLIQLVERFRGSEQRCVVKNYVHRSSHADDFPGVREFILTPIAKATRLMGWLVAINRESDGGVNPDELPWELSQYEYGTNEATLLSSTASILATHARNVELFREKEALLISTVRALVSAVEAKDMYTCGHSERVALYGRRLAMELGCSEDFCERLYLTGLLHDVGKIGIRDAILKKPEALTDDEFEEIKQHPDKGWAILYDIEPLRYVLPGVLHHHERYDGQGYPDGLAGRDIPLEGRILSVVDAYDAMTSNRPYRYGMAQSIAERVLQSGAGVQWDADIVDAFFRIMPEIIQIRDEYQHRTIPVRKARALVD